MSIGQSPGSAHARVFAALAKARMTDIHMSTGRAPCARAPGQSAIKILGLLQLAFIV